MKKTIALLMACALLAALAGCRNGTPAPGSSSAPESSAQSQAGATVGDYFPITNDTSYVYQGEGSEYASYTVYNDYTSSTQIQQRIDNGGTVVARVITVSDGKAVRTFSRGETYHRQNYMGETGGEEILLMEPIVKGTTWTLEDGGTRTITSLSAPVSTPSGDYDAIEVTTEGTNAAAKEYYAKGVGLVRAVYPMGDAEVSSTLGSVQKNVPLTQTVRLFYPDAAGKRVLYEDREIEFRTNDSTGDVLAAAYKEAPAGTTAVLLGDTEIKSLALGDEGVAKIDLSQAFLTEIKKLPASEEKILQSVADTVGYYFGADKVVLTVESKPYDSGEITLKEGDSLRTDFGTAAPFSS